jgi:hypothetical protein
MADDSSYVVGCNSPLRPDERSGRGWPTVVHAVGRLAEGEPFRAVCGVYVLFKYEWHLWPPDLIEDCCPACVRATEDHPTGV